MQHQHLYTTIADENVFFLTIYSANWVVSWVLLKCQIRVLRLSSGAQYLSIFMPAYVCTCVCVQRF